MKQLSVIGSVVALGSMLITACAPSVGKSLPTAPGSVSTASVKSPGDNIVLSFKPQDACSATLHPDFNKVYADYVRNPAYPTYYMFTINFKAFVGDTQTGIRPLGCLKVFGVDDAKKTMVDITGHGGVPMDVCKVIGDVTFGKHGDRGVATFGPSSYLACDVNFYRELHKAPMQLQALTVDHFDGPAPKTGRTASKGHY